MLLLFRWEMIGQPMAFETHMWKAGTFPYVQEGDSKARTLTSGFVSLQVHRLICWLPRDQTVPSLEWVAGRRCVCVSQPRTDLSMPCYLNPPCHLEACHQDNQVPGAGP